MKFFVGICVFNIIVIVWSQDNVIKLVVLKEKEQIHVADWFQETFKNNQQNMRFEAIIVDLDEEEQDEDNICNSLTQGGTIIIDLTWTGNVKAKEIVTNLNIPYVDLDISISPFLSLLDKYLEFRNSTDVSIIFDSPSRVDQALYYWIDTTLLRMVISENLDKTASKRLRGIRPIPNNFALIGTTSTLNYLFKTAIEENLVVLPERWNLVFLDFKSNDFDRNSFNLTLINMLNLDEQVCCNILGSQSCTCPKDFDLGHELFLIVMMILKEVITNLSNQKLEFTNNLKCNGSQYNEETKKQFDELFQKEINQNSLLATDAGAIILNTNGTVSIGNNDSIMTEVAKINVKHGLTLIEGQQVPAITAYYRIGITHALPWSFKQTDENGNTYWTGYCVDFAEKLSEVMNFQYEFVEPESGSFGNKKDGVWNGVIGDLANGETDLAITALIMTADREEVVDFVAPYFEQTGITIVMRKPVRKTSLFKFMTVLKLEVWLSIVGALIVTGFMVWFLDKYSPYSARNNKKAYPYPCREFTLKESFWFALTSFTPQGGGEAPKALSGRTLVAAYWLFVVLMLATFTANLAAFLTVERMQTPVQSLEQLAKQSRINYTVVKDSDTHIYFINMKNAEDTLYRMWKELTLNASTDDTQYRVWDYPIREQYGHILLAINDSNPVANASEGFRIVNEHTDADFAFIHDSSEIKYEISRNCNLTEVGEVFAEKPYAIAVQQGSHLQDEISKAILNLQKDRFFEEIQAKWWNPSAKGSCPTTDDNEGITLESLGGVFIATLFGLALAMITLVGEVLYYRRKAKIHSSDSKKKIFSAFTVKTKEDKSPITIGTEFKPVNFRDKNISELAHVTLYPRSRNRITRIN